MRWHTFDGDVSNYEVHYEPGDVEYMHFAAMVHNCCGSLPNESSELLILGGGVSSFACLWTLFCRVSAYLQLVVVPRVQFLTFSGSCCHVRLEDVHGAKLASRGSRGTSILETLRQSAAVTLDKEEKDKEDDNKHVTRVFYVANHDAKAPRTALKAEDLLDNT